MGGNPRPEAGGSPPKEQNHSWRQYELHARLYSHYLKLILEFNVFYYAATGAIVSYCLKNTEVHTIRFALLFPVFMSLGFAGLFFYGALKTTAVRQELHDICVKLGLQTFLEYRVLTALLVITASLMVIVAIGISILFSFLSHGSLK